MKELDLIKKSIFTSLSNLCPIHARLETWQSGMTGIQLMLLLFICKKSKLYVQLDEGGLALLLQRWFVFFWIWQLLSLSSSGRHLQTKSIKHPVMWKCGHFRKAKVLMLEMEDTLTTAVWNRITATCNHESSRSHNKTLVCWISLQLSCCRPPALIGQRWGNAGRQPLRSAESALRRVQGQINLTAGCLGFTTERQIIKV